MPSTSQRGQRSVGQGLAEFALVVPIFLALVGAVIQFGLIFWAQNTLTQVVRDAGRWEATQQACNSSALGALGPQINSIAGSSSLLGYSTSWAAPVDVGTDASVGTFTTANAVAVAWVRDSGPGIVCPPKTNATNYHVTIRVNHVVPTFFPGMQYLPGLGTCDSAGCRITLSSTAQFRMEPAP